MQKKCKSSVSTHYYDIILSLHTLFAEDQKKNNIFIHRLQKYVQPSLQVSSLPMQEEFQ